jgi:peptide methionine sulfoxide reductase MsrB
MTDSACATFTGKIAKAHVAWRPPLRAAQTCLTREHDTEWARLSELNCDMSGSTLACTCCREPLFALDATGDFVAPCDLGTGWSNLAARLAVAVATKPENRRLARRIAGRCAHHTAHPTRIVPDVLRDGVNGAALRFRPGGT